MVLKKCVSCNKNITKKSPGLECNRCNKYFHAKTNCANLTNRQLDVLQTTIGLEWSCKDCLRDLTKRSSYFLPTESDSEEEEIDNNKIGKYDDLVNQISCETRNIIKSELESVTTSMDRMNKQIADLERNMIKQENALKTLFNKNTELVKKNKILEVRICAREQTIREADQKLLSTCLEITGIPESNSEDPLVITKKLAKILNVSDQQIVNARRSSSCMKIIVEFHSKGACEEWIESAKTRDIVASSICTDLPAEDGRSRIFVRTILTQQTKILLNKAKISLSNSFKYIWCKDGKIYAKKDDDSREFHVIRCVSDIESLCESQS